MKKIIRKRIMVFLLVLTIPTGNVFAGEMTEEPVCPQNQSDPGYSATDLEAEVPAADKEKEGNAVLGQAEAPEENSPIKDELQEEEQTGKYQEISVGDFTAVFGCSPFSVRPEDMEDRQFSYKISDESVALVDKEGFVICKKTGDTKLTITALQDDCYEKSEKTVTLTVVSSLEKGRFQVASIVKGGIQLTWKPIDGAEGYFLYRRNSTEKSYRRIAECPAEKNSYTDTAVSSGVTYYYKVKGYASSKKDVGESGDSKKMTYILPPTVSASREETGTQIRWNRVPGASGYYVYRRTAAQSSWSKVAVITEPGEILWLDTSASDGIVYYYSVQACNGASVSQMAAQRSYVRIAAPRIRSWKRKSSTRIKLSWSRSASASGYQIQYARNSMFSGAKTKTIKSGKTTAYTVSKLGKNKTYYARIRAYRKVGGATYYSPWSASGNTTSTKKTKAVHLKKKNRVFEIRSFAKQKMNQYDTLQGSCTDGTYAYYLLYNRKAVKCKVVKVKRSSLKVVKVSGPLDVAHGNDMTYNPHKKQLVIVHSTGEDPKRLTTVHPGTLKITGSRHIKIPNKLSGGSTADAKGATAFSGIAYSSGRRQYAVLLSRSYNFVVLDANMDPIRYVKVSKKNNYTVQGIDATDDYILVAQSPKTKSQKYNIITVYNWDGKYISKINVKKGYEIESIYHVGSKYYAGFYRSYYKTYYKKVTKKIKVKGKVKKKKVRVKYRKYQRDNYVYELTGL